jgi:tripartite-type tricarboxylate transporter receptor subunit TctC
MQELVDDPKAKQVLRFLSLDTAIARAFVTGPGVPAERVAALRRAFELALKDPDLLAEAKKTHTDISPSSGKEAQEVATEIVSTQPEIVALAKKVLF